MKYLKLFALVVLLSCGMSPHNKELANFWGSWKVVHAQPAGDCFALTEEEENSYLNKVFTFRPEFVVSDFDVCTNARYSCEELLLSKTYSEKVQAFLQLLPSTDTENYKALYITTCHNSPLDSVIKLSDEVATFGLDGFIFFLRKLESLNKKYTGKGKKSQVLKLSGAGSTLRLVCRFRKAPGQLFIEDQDGKQLFNTTIGVADSIELASVALHKSTKLVFKVRPNDPSTKWQLDVEIY